VTEGLLNVAPAEELVLAAPTDFAPLRATRVAPTVATDLSFSFLLRDIRTASLSL
jgi:hypothetical protein